MAEKWKQLGSVRVGKTKPDGSPGGFYIKVTEAVTLTPDDVIHLQDPRKKLTESVAAGRLSEEMAETYREKIPSWVKYDLVLAPKK
jgi:hypothetical protein